MLFLDIQRSQHIFTSSHSCISLGIAKYPPNMHAQFEVLRLICHAAMLKVAWFCTTSDDLTWSSQQFPLAWHDDLKCQGEAQLITRLLALAQEEWSSFSSQVHSKVMSKNPTKPIEKPSKLPLEMRRFPLKLGMHRAFSVSKSPTGQLGLDLASEFDKAFWQLDCLYYLGSPIMV